MSTKGAESVSAKIKQYLLGNLAQSEVEELDEQIIFDESFEEKILAAEHELIEDYLENALSAEENLLFRNNFLVSEEREKLLRDVALLKKYAKNAFENEELNSAAEKTPDGFWSGLKNRLSIGLRPAVAAAFALILIGLLAFSGWRIFLTDSPSALEAQYAALNQKDLSNTAEFAGFSNVSLFPGTFREAGPVDQLQAAKLTESVYFRLALPFEINRETVFKAELLKDGKSLFTQDQIHIYQNAGSREARLLLPKSVFTKGLYQIRLEKASDRNLVVIYGFAVE